MPVFLSSDGLSKDVILKKLPREKTRSKLKSAIPDSKRFRDPRLIYELSGLLWEDRSTHTLHVTELGRLCAKWVNKLTLENYSLLARHAILALSEMHLQNPTDEGKNYTPNMDVFPALFVWQAMLQLDGRISSEEMNRAIMNTSNYSDLQTAIQRIRRARATNDSSRLGTPVVPKKKSQNDRIISWMSLVSFGWLLMKDKRESSSEYYELRPECIPMIEHACGLERKHQNFSDIAAYANHLSSAAFRTLTPKRKLSTPILKKQRYEDYGEAPDDDPAALQNFARAVRKGQPKFRKNLLKLYNGRCAISGWIPSEVLEAAHIEPHSRSGINKSANGILLRSDLHSLMDAGLVRIAADTFTVIVDEILRNTPYWQYNGKTVQPRSDGSQIGKQHITSRWKSS